MVVVHKVVVRMVVRRFVRTFILNKIAILIFNRSGNKIPMIFFKDRQYHKKKLKLIIYHLFHQ